MTDILELRYLEFVLKELCTAARLLQEKQGKTYQVPDYKRRQLLKMLTSPYFGKITFLYDGDDPENAEDFYIGIGDFRIPGSETQLIYDWRAPISSLFYDYSKGSAAYEAPTGGKLGVIQRKKQFHIKDGRMECMLDYDQRTEAHLLHKTLSQASSAKLKTIIATIQKEQNAIIRDENNQYLAVQGAAGSGKTSIALHRIAFLLYRRQRALDILLLSPNKIVSDYLSNVLPQLGEENLLEMSFKDIIWQELKDIPCETRTMQLERLLEQPDSSALILLQFKKSSAFADKLKSFPTYFALHYTAFEDIQVLGIPFSGRILENLFFDKYHSYPVFVRLKHMAEFLCDVVESKHQLSISAAKRMVIEERLRSFIQVTELAEIYQIFLKWSGVPSSCLLAGGRLPQEDVFPMIYLKYTLLGGRKFPRTKHLIIDEMQDYSIIQYELLKLMFHCPMTFLGDAGQSLDGGNVSAILKSVFPNIRHLELKQCYRSTYEITVFANIFMKVRNAVPFERHGQLPILYSCLTPECMWRSVWQTILACRQDGFHSIAIICRSEKEARRYYRRMKEMAGDWKANITLLAAGDTSFSSGTVLTSALISRGLEFDAVLIPNVGSDNCRTEMERRLLYVACNRALHRLYLFTPQEEIPYALKPAKGLFAFQTAPAK